MPVFSAKKCSPTIPHPAQKSATFSPAFALTKRDKSTESDVKR